MGLLEILQTGGANDKGWDPALKPRAGKGTEPAVSIDWPEGKTLLDLAQAGHPLAMWKVDSQGKASGLSTDSKIGLPYIETPGKGKEGWLYLAPADGSKYDPKNPPQASNLVTVSNIAEYEQKNKGSK